MLAEPNIAAERLGADLRALRKRRGLTLHNLGDTLGKSVGWLSQVERGLSLPSSDDILAFANALGVAPSALTPTSASPDAAASPIVRKGQRRALRPRREGLFEELLSPDLTDDFEVVHSTFAPQSGITTEVKRPTQEVGYIVSGKLDLDIAGVPYTVRQGDSFRIRGEAFTWANPFDEPCVAIWVIAPPVY
ncbi:MAG: XRE family transcriptional regulator [Pseudomonadota bacterium]